jgi:hypothetical protein
MIQDLLWDQLEPDRLPGDVALARLLTLFRSTQVRSALRADIRSRRAVNAWFTR